MKIFLFSFVIIFAAANFSLAQGFPVAPVASPEQILLEKLKEWSTAIERQDADALRKLSADNHMYTGFEGIPMRREEDIKSLTSGLYRVENIKTSDVLVRIFNDNTAVITGAASYKESVRDRSDVPKIRFTQVWVKFGDDWKMVSEQSTKIQQNQPDKNIAAPKFD